jgi:hypothetical protein
MIYAAFCGTGKSYLTNKSPNDYIEFECWKYQGYDFPNNYIREIISNFDKIKYIFISTNPVVLRALNKLGYEIQLCYPKNELKEEYFKRYVDRGSSSDFLEMLNVNWDIWLDELKDETYCNHIVLDKNEYLSKYI